MYDNLLFWTNVKMIKCVENTDINLIHDQTKLESDNSSSANLTLEYYILNSISNY